MVDENDLNEARARLREMDTETLAAVIRNHKALEPLLNDEAALRGIASPAHKFRVGDILRFNHTTHQMRVKAPEVGGYVLEDYFGSDYFTFEEIERAMHLVETMLK